MDAEKERKQLKKKKALQALDALAQESRLDIFLLLMEYRPQGGLPAGTISQMLGIPPTTMSFHLAQLKIAGLIKADKQGRSIIYRASRGRAKQLAHFILNKKPTDIGPETPGSALGGDMPSAGTYQL